MRPKLFTVRNLILFLLACGIFGALAYWGSLGFPLPGSGVPSTAGKIVFVSDRAGADDLFLMEAREGAEAVALTEGDMKDGEPVFTPDGQLVIFTSNRQRDALGGFQKGVVRHLCALQAAPGKRVGQITQSSASSGTKEAPFIADRDRVYYLDGGRIVSVHVDGSDPEAVFPHVEMKRGNQLIADLFERGGIREFSVSPDGLWAAAIVKREDDVVLVIYDVANEFPAAAAAGQAIHCRFLPDGSLVASIADGTPFKQPVPLDNETALKVPNLAAIVPSSMGVVEGKQTFVHFRFGAEGFGVDGANELPFAPDGIVPSPDGTRIAIYVGRKDSAGMIVAPLTGDGGQAVTVTDLPVTSASFSPDGKQVVFAASGDIYLVPSDGSGPPVNLTGGKGRNRAPVYSPATDRP